MCVSVEKSISSLQIGFNGPLLEDAKYKTSEQRFQNVPFFGKQLFLCHESLTRWSVELLTKFTADGRSERASE